MRACWERVSDDLFPAVPCRAHRQILFCPPQRLTRLWGASGQKEQQWPVDPSTPSLHLSPHFKEPNIHSSWTQTTWGRCPGCLWVQYQVWWSGWNQDQRPRSEASGAHPGSSSSRANRASLHRRHLHEWRHPTTNSEFYLLPVQHVDFIRRLRIKARMCRIFTAFKLIWSRVFYFLFGCFLTFVGDCLSPSATVGLFDGF